MLERSRTAPLTIRISIGYQDLADNAFLSSVRLALSHIRHIRHLSIFLSNRFRDLGDLLSPFLTGSPDILEELILASPSVFPDYVYPSMENAPYLRVLELSSCHLNWKLFSSIGNLTTLVLKDIPMASRPSIENILSLLQIMSKLEILALIHAISELPTNIRTLPPHDIPPIKLEHLIDLSLTGFVLDCANVMRHFVIPRCRQVTLSAVTRWHIPEVALAIPPLADIISSSFSQLDRQELPYHASIRSWYHSMTITAHPVEDADELFLDLYLTWQPSRQPDNVEVAPNLSNLLSSLPLGRIVQFNALLFCAEHDTAGVEWLKVFPHLTRVETVLLSGGYTYGFVSAFHDAHVIDVSSTSGTNEIVLPNLTSLTIEHAHFSFPLGDNQLFPTFKRALTRRSKLEWAVPHIKLLNCHITPQQLADLNTVAFGQVFCDGEPDTWGVGESDGESNDEGSFLSDDEG
ncbi:hypothetical protein F5148DRAFT_1192336 [Russula earlei]|uniref:Uncharacterized protein n=1 Tax=Russula earlei TaxID=71964 RepID=A0ACC0UDD2_9AGAM|nr:hypothetical protein F5148DRAFT_1192336 [Russula earlei]